VVDICRPSGEAMVTPGSEVTFRPVA
jgi:hypothetical protein